MHGLTYSCTEKKVNWSNASEDYAQFRPPPPLSFFERLSTHGIGCPNQRILDLGTGTGALALQFAKQGALVTGVDICEGQISQAKKLAQQRALPVNFLAASAEAPPFPDHSFEVITASQCWLYFDLSKVIPQVKRLLTPGGRLVTSHFSYLAILDPVANATERLIKHYNPSWEWDTWDGQIPAVPDWVNDQFKVAAYFWYDEPIKFTHESWRGRIRAHRAIGAELAPEQIQAFDNELKEYLAREVPDPFFVLHRIDAHFFTL